MSDVQSIPSPNNNKLVASLSGGAGGITVGGAVLAVLQFKYSIDMGPVLSGIFASAITAAAASFGAWLAPILTAAQHRAIRALDGSANDDQKEILMVGKAQAIVAAASKGGTP